MEIQILLQQEITKSAEIWRERYYSMERISKIVYFWSTRVAEGWGLFFFKLEFKFMWLTVQVEEIF